MSAPRDWDAQRMGAECESLWVRAEEGLPTRLTSAWRPSPEELEVLNAGGCVTVTVWSGNHPPLSLGVQAPQ